MDEFSHGEAFDTCTKVLINSSIAVACGPFFDRDIMHAMEICVEDVRITMNEMASKNSIALLEAQVRNIWFFLLSIPQNNYVFFDIIVNFIIKKLQSKHISLVKYTH